MERRQTCPLCRQRDAITFPSIVFIPELFDHRFNVVDSNIANDIQAAITRMMNQNLANATQVIHTPTIIDALLSDFSFEHEATRLANTLNERQQPPPPFIGPITLPEAIVRRNLHVEQTEHRMMMQNILSIGNHVIISENDDEWDQLEPIL